MKGVAIAVLLAGGAVTPAPSQVAANRAARYLFPTNVRDGRAVWVNPAGTAVTPLASVYGDVVLRGDGARLTQITAGFGSRGLTFGYQYDRFETGRGHTYRLGLAGSTGPLSVGVTAAHYRGDASAWGYDVGALIRSGPAFTLGATAANIGQPVVRGVRQAFALVPGATATPLGPALELSALARLSDAGDGYSVGARWQPPLRLRSAVLVRLDWDGDLRHTGFAFGVAIGDLDQVGVVLTTPRDVATVEASSVYGVAARPMGSR
jgi:hypothetical protein